MTCPGGAKKWDGNDHCYWRVGSKDHFPDAAEACAQAGGYLATIHSQAENDFIDHEIIDKDSWIGGSDMRDQKDDGVGTYVWINGEAWTWTNWDNDEPNSGWTPCDWFDGCFEHCAVIQKNGKWDDRHCDRRDYEYVCESEL